MDCEILAKRYLLGEKGQWKEVMQHLPCLKRLRQSDEKIKHSRHIDANQVRIRGTKIGGHILCPSQSMVDDVPERIHRLSDRYLVIME
jgi:hypothetical protein